MASEHIERLKEISAALPDVDSEIADVRAELAMVRAALYVVPRAIVSSDVRGRITYFNVEAQRMFGIKEGDALGSALTLLMPERYREAYAAAMTPLAGRENNDVREIVGHGMRADGSEFPVKVRLAIFPKEERFAFTAVIEAVPDDHG